MRCRVTTNPEEAAWALCQGKLVALPTETVYGLAGNALDAETVAKIFAAKDRPYFDPLIVHIPSQHHLSEVVAEFPPRAQQLADRFWPGPLTLVLPKADQIPPIVTSGLSTVGIRVPKHVLTQQVLEFAKIPVAAPSANLFGRLSPTTAEHVWEQLGDRIDLVLDGGPCSVGVESTIIHVDGARVCCLRPGGTPLEEIESMLGSVEIIQSNLDQQPLAPGQLSSHYAPRTPIRLVDRLPEIAPHSKCGALTFGSVSTTGYDKLEILSASGNLTEAAAQFFPALHRLDHRGLQVILATQFPNIGLGRALNDRLFRATYSDVNTP